jgi:uncharacterized OB-fold protein
MTGVPDFPPLFTPHVRPFYEGLEAGELRMTACPKCQAWYWYPPEVLPCHPEAHPEWKAVSPEGKVFMYTTIHRSLLPTDQGAATPYTVVLAESDTVPGARIPGLFVNAGGREPACEMRVRFTPVRAGDHLVAGFEPID